jgi:hypothetical protein
MHPCYRVFGTNGAQPDPATLLDTLRRQGFDVTGHFRGDDQGWFQLRLVLAGSGAEVVADCYLPREEDLGDELPAWAAWLEEAGDSPVHVRLMGQVIATTHLFVILQPQEPGPARELCEALCSFLAWAMDGVWQVDGRGFFAADGTLLVAED